MSSEESERQIVISKKRVNIHPDLKKAVFESRLTKQFIETFPKIEQYKLGVMIKAREFFEQTFGHRGLPIVDDFELYDHQLQTIDFMTRIEKEGPIEGINGGFVLLMMGLGKSLTSVSHSLMRPKGEYPTLIVCPKTLMREWRYECFEQFFNNDGLHPVKVLYLHTDFMSRSEINELERSTFKKYDFVVTTYDVILSAFNQDDSLIAHIAVCGDKHGNGSNKIQYYKRREINSVTRANPKGVCSIMYTPWERMICDESHKFANSDTFKHRSLLAVYSKYTWCLSGTWIRNHTTDIFAQLKICGYNGLNTNSEWKKYGKSEFHEKKLYNRILEMNYKQAGIEMPSHTVQIVECQIEGRHRELYDMVKNELVSSMTLFESKNESWMSVFEKFMRLRQIAIAPCVMFHSGTKKASAQQLEWACDVQGPGGVGAVKIQKVLELIKKIPKDEKYLVFSQYKTSLDVLLAGIESRTRDNAVFMNGEMSGMERNATISQFKSDPDTRGLLMTYGVGSEGINLTCACHVILLEPWWSNAVHFQAFSRSLRMGQKKHVNIYYMVVTDTIEESILDVCNEKIEEAAEFLSDDGADSIAKGLSKELLNRIIRH